MIKLHSALNGFEIHNLKNALESCGIACEVQGELRRPGMGELPVTECWVELWLIDEARQEEARRIVAEGIPGTQGPWRCDGCGETVEGQFGQCWSCGHERRS